MWPNLTTTRPMRIGKHKEQRIPEESARKDQKAELYFTSFFEGLDWLLAGGLAAGGVVCSALPLGAGQSSRAIAEQEVADVVANIANSIVAHRA